RTCTVPANKPVYFPLLNQVCPKVGDQSAEDALKGCAVVGNGTAKLDGRPLKAKVETSVGAFDFEPREGNDLASYSGDAVASGIWVGPLKLSPGKHTLEIHATANDFAVGVTYKLTVR